MQLERLVPGELGWVEPINNNSETIENTMADMAKQVDETNSNFTKVGATVNFYVSPNGNDINGNGTSTNPFKTIQKAVNEISKYAGNVSKAIHLEDGVYNLAESFFITNVHGLTISAKIEKTNEAERSVFINGHINISGSSVRFFGINFKSTTETLEILSYHMSSGYVRHCSFESISINTTNHGGCISSYSGSSVATYRCTYKNARKALLATQASAIGDYNSTFYDCNWFAETQTGGRISAQAPIVLGVYDLLFRYHPASIILWDTPLVLSSAGAEWFDLTLQNGFQAYSLDSAYRPQYCRIGNIVFLSGLVKHNTGITPLNTIIATLPIGYRPTNNIHAVVSTMAAFDFARAQISIKGEIIYQGTTNQSNLNTYGGLNCSFAI